MHNVISFVIGALSLLISPNTPQTPAPSIFVSTTPLVVDTSPEVNLKELEKLKAKLPIGEIGSYPASNSWAQAILIPQSHRYPGSDIGDKKNDKAEMVQNQIYQILSKINKDLNVNFVMAEGDLYGQVPEDKIKSLTNQIALRNQFVEKSNDLKRALNTSNLNEKNKEKIYRELDKTLSSLNREISLKGAPYQLKAEGADVTLFGAENETTREKSALIVRNYIYAKDRLAQIGQKNTAIPSPAQQSTTRLSGSYVQNLISKLLAGKSGSYLSSLKKYAKKTNNKILLDAVSSTNGVYSESKKNNNKPSDSAAKLPSRQNNPYNAVNDETKMRNILSSNEKKIEDVVLNERNKDAANNFQKALSENNIKSGIIQYGAEHEKGLTEELNKLGISVYVVKPQQLTQ